jgi:hypothetical protein
MTNPPSKWRGRCPRDMNTPMTIREQAVACFAVMALVVLALSLMATIG